MARRQREWAHRGRDELLQQLGCACAVCGSDIALEFDHHQGRRYDLRTLSQDQRVTRLRREIAGGLIRLLCKTHNGADGGRRRWARRAG